MRPWSEEPAGRFEELTFESEALRGNPLGDPSERPLWVYLPPAYDDDRGRRFPSVYAIQGLMGQLDEPDMRAAARALRDSYGGSFKRFWEDFRSRPAFTKESDSVLLNMWCMAACYSADEDGAVRLPFDPLTSRLDDKVWQRWLRWDPVRMVPHHAEALRGMRAIYIDAGKRDEWFLDLGAEAFRRGLEHIGVSDVYFELFDAGHMGIEHRYPIALKYLAERLSPG